MRVARLPRNPIICPETLGYDTQRLGTNINGPSLIRTPDWLPNALGRYYLYFAHHQGDHIRLAYADDLEGPWRIHSPGTLHLEGTGFSHHIASPDVHVDNANRRIRMYFHGLLPQEERDNQLHKPLLHRDYPMPHSGQMTRVAVSDDGISFEVHPPVITSFYLRVFEHGGWHYGIAMPFVFYRSPNGLTDWEVGPMYFDYRIRHSAVHKQGDTLRVFFSRREDCPERIMMTLIDLSRDWYDWQPSEPVTVLAPEESWEGSDEPPEASRTGAVHERVHQLRDPAIFLENGRTYLLYSVAGESGIAIAELHEDPPQK